jgi:type I restriction enzyme S subunit
MEVRKGYKLTEAGVIPEDWEVKHLGEVTDLEVGYGFKSAWFKKYEGVPLLRGENVGYGHPDWSDTRRLAEKQAASFSSYLLQPSDIVIGMDRTFTKSGSKISIIRDIDCPCLLVQRVGKFVPKKCNSGFLWALLSSEKFQKLLQVEQKGMDIPHLSRFEILHPLVSIPPLLAEQEAIAEALSDVDALIEAVEQLLTKKRQVKQGAMSELLTGKRRLFGFSGEWEVKTIGEIGYKFLNGGTPSTKKEEYWEGNIPWITGADFIDQKVADIRRFITTEAVNNSATNVIEKGNLLVVTRTGVGKIAIAPFDLAISQDVTGVYVKKEYVLPEFLFWYFYYNTGSLRNLNQGTSISGITRDTLTSLSISLPSLAEQTAIAEILSDMDAEISALEGKLVKARQVKAGMVSELLGGKIRLV